MTTDTSPAPTAAGRPRSLEADEAIYDATVDILNEMGYGGVSIEAIAAAAGVAKTTIYRRHKTKEDLVVAALGCRLHTAEMELTGDFKADLSSLISRIRDNMVDNHGIRTISAILVEMERTPLLMETFREKWLAQRGKRFVGFVDAAQRAGIVRADVDAGVVHDMAVGALIARTMVSGYPDASYAKLLANQIWSSIAIDPSRTTAAS